MNLPALQTARAVPPDEDPDAWEFAAFAGAQDPLDLEAATWATRRRAGLDAAGQAELQVWLARDPRHAAALEDMQAMLGGLGALPDAAVQSLKASLPDRRVPSQPAAKENSPSWLAGWSRLVPAMGAALLVVMTVAGGWIGWDHWQRRPVFVQAFATERGQQLTARLPDDAAAGSTLVLDTATRLEARLFRHEREVVLANGQAMFSVHSDASRPFHVRAGSLRITVVGTRFSVRHTASGLDAGRTVVSVEEGHVRVARLDAEPAGDVPTASAQDAVDLTAGRMLVAEGDGAIGPAMALAPGAIAQWRGGRISFDHTPLSQALAEFERYGPTGLVVRDPAVAAMPVGGSYDLRQFAQFARTLPEVLPVRLERSGDVTVIVPR